MSDQEKTAFQKQKSFQHFIAQWWKKRQSVIFLVTNCLIFFQSGCLFIFTPRLGYFFGVSFVFMICIIDLRLSSGSVSSSAAAILHPNRFTAFLAVSISVSASGPFIEIKIPPIFIYGMQYSQSAGRFATALDTE